MSATQILESVNNYTSIHDADLLLRLRIALSVKRRAGWHLVSISVRGGAVKLAGVVPSPYDRQLIASLAQHVAGVLRIEDELAIGEPSLRQQLPEADQKSESPTALTSPVSPFAHLPVLAELLDDIVPVRAGEAVAPAA